MYFYRRLFVVTSRSKTDIISYVIIGLIVAWLVAFEFLFTFSCGVHVDAIWGTFEQTETYCHGQGAFRVEQSLSISDLILDLIVFVFPFPAVCTLDSRS